MPEFSPFLLLILFFGVSWLIKRIKLIKTMTNNQARPAAYPPASPPSHFQEEAPVTAKRPSPVTKEKVPQTYKPLETLKQTPWRELDSFQEGQRAMNVEEPSWYEKPDQKYQPAKAAPPRKPRFPIIPVFTGSSAVQAIVTKEILTRPRSAMRQNRP
jgi:hypothetical protein